MVSIARRRLIVLALTICAVVSAVSLADAAPSSLEILAGRGGVEARSLKAFFEKMASEAPAKSLVMETSSVQCFDRFADTESRRTEAVDCLTKIGISGLNESLFKRLMEVHTPLMSRLPDGEMLKSLALLNYLEDLVRARLTLIGQEAHWFAPGQGFLASKSKEDFKFQDGDIVAGLGNSSISSLISQVTNPPGRYSHVFMVRVRDGKLTTIESLIETGVREFPWKHFTKDQYNTLTVLRWKNPANRAAVTRRASDAALAYSKKGIDYDVAIDLDSDNKMFCTELVVKSYMDGSGEAQSRILPHQAVVRSEPAFGHVQNLGVTNRTFVAPGDLLNSDLFEVVGEYRRTEDLYKAWKLFLMGDVFLERIEEGYKVTPGLFYATMPVAVWLAQLLPSMFHEDFRLIPKSFGPASFAVTATVEKSIYGPALSAADSEGAPSLFETSLWDYRVSLRTSVERNRALVHPDFPLGEQRSWKNAAPRLK